MKKVSIILALAAVVLGFSSCKQEDNPQYHNPTTFTVSTPAMQDVEFETATEMTDAATFNLFCTQPDYGYSAICKYTALVSLNPEAPEEEWVALENQNPASAAMSIKTFDLGIALLKLSKITSQEEFEASEVSKKPMKAYFRAVCEIEGIEGSRIVSQNAVTYNAISVKYAEKKAAWIYICGDLRNPETGVEDGFKGPNAANFDHYKNNFALYEPTEKIGEKLFVGVFDLVPKADKEGKSEADQCSQFRFFTELLGWVADASLGSNEADFYCLPVTDKWQAGFSGDVIPQGLGNWGVNVDVYSPVTIVVDTQNNKIYIKEGAHNVTFTGRTPSFE